MIKGEGMSTLQPKLFVIQVSKAVIHMVIGPKPLVIQTPSSFPYKNNKVVPWRYGVSIVQGGKNKESTKKGEAKVENILGFGA